MMCRVLYVVALCMRLCTSRVASCSIAIYERKERSKKSKGKISENQEVVFFRFA